MWPIAWSVGDKWTALFVLKAPMVNISHQRTNFGVNSNPKLLMDGFILSIIAVPVVGMNKRNMTHKQFMMKTWGKMNEISQDL